MDYQKVEIEGNELEVGYRIIEGMRSDDWRYPDDPDEVEIFEVWENDKNIREEISYELESKIEEELFNQ